MSVRGRTVLWFVAGLFPGTLMGQAAPAYSASIPGCARFGETVRTSLTLQTSGRTASATSGRDSELTFAVREGAVHPVLQVVAWFDSLVVWRSVAGTRVEPDASGVLGGRYRGELLPDGTMTTATVPFVPQDVKEVTDLAGVLDDMLPRLPPRLMQVGEEWRSGDTLAIKRLSDSSATQRYRVQLLREGPVSPPPGDTLSPTYTRQLDDRGIVAWVPSRGVVRFEHDITVEANVPAGRAVRVPARSLVEQHVVLVRLADPPAGTCPSSLFDEP